MPADKHMKRIDQIEKEMAQILYKANTRSLRQDNPQYERYRELKFELEFEQRQVSELRKKMMRKKGKLF